MTKLRLPDVTLVAVDTASHDLTRMALEECTAKVDFGDVLVFSDKHILPGSQWHFVEPLTLEGATRAYWYLVPQAVRTSHFLIIHHDSWVTNPKSWDDAFLIYDYVGAPWWYADAYNVGNGGFSLRSVSLMQRVARDPQDFPFSMPEDDALCRRHRTVLEAEGYRWAPNHVAMCFSRERVVPFDADGYPIKTFGFHGMFLWPDVLTDEQIGARLAVAPDHVLNHIHFQQMSDLLKTRGRALRARSGAQVYAA